jgi:hypothetical protein
MALSRKSIKYARAYAYSNGDIRDSECGEQVIFRAMYIGLSDYEFMKFCMNIGGHQLFDLISKLDRPDIYSIFFPGTANSTPESKHNDLIIITGRKGSGKTELAKYIADIYHINNPNNRVIILCGIKDLYNDLPYAKIIDLKLIEEEENNKKKNDYSGMPDVSDFKDSLVIFDDTEQYPNPKLESMIRLIKGDILLLY